MGQSKEESFFMDWESSSLVSETKCQVAKCRTMVEYLYTNLGTVYDWEEGVPGRMELKDELLGFADIAFDYIIDAFNKLEKMEEATQIINAPAPTKVQGAKQITS